MKETFSVLILVAWISIGLGVILTAAKQREVEAPEGGALWFMAALWPAIIASDVYRMSFPRTEACGADGDRA